MATLLPASRRARLILAGLAAVVVLALVYTAGVVSAGAFEPGENSPEAGFARDMSLHHEQAVEMGMLAYAKATNPVVKHAGYDIATTQANQIGTMQGWLTQWHVSLTSTDAPMAWMHDRSQLLPDGRMPGMASDADMRRLDTLTGRDFDVLFCQLMIQHHQGGIHMIEAIIAASRNTEVVTLARNMQQNQLKEIGMFQDLLTQMGAKAL